MGGPKSSEAEEYKTTIIRGGAPKFSKHTGHFWPLMFIIRWVLEFRPLILGLFPTGRRFNILRGIFWSLFHDRCHFHDLYAVNFQRQFYIIIDNGKIWKVRLFLSSKELPLGVGEGGVRL